MAILTVQGVLLDKISTRQEYNLGDIYEDQGKIFRYVKYNQGDDAVAGVAGRLVIGLDSACPNWEVTMDYDTSTITGIPNDQKGFLQAALTNGTYGWIQVAGRNVVAMLTDGGVTQGQLLMKHATTDGSVDSHTGDVPILAVALEADSGTSLAIGHADIKIGM